MENNQIIAEGVPPEEGKFCADCKHLIGVRYNKQDSANWNCGYPDNDLGFGPASLITGIKKRKFAFRIEDLRYQTHPQFNICGPNGKWYEKYEPPQYDVVDTIGGEEPVIFDEAAMAAGKEAAAKRLADLKAKKGIK